MQQKHFTEFVDAKGNQLTIGANVTYKGEEWTVENFFKDPRHKGTRIRIAKQAKWRDLDSQNVTLVS